MVRQRHHLLAALAALCVAGVLAGCAGTDGSVTRSSRSMSPVRTTRPSATTSTIATSTTTPDPRSTVPGAPPVKVGSPQLAPTAAAHLSLGIDTASTGTPVTVTVTGCPEPTGGYSGFFADSQALGDPQTSGYRHPFTLTGTGEDGATGTYVVSAADTPGFGLMEVPCGAATNAVAEFTIIG